MSQHGVTIMGLAPAGSAIEHERCFRGCRLHHSPVRSIPAMPLNLISQMPLPDLDYVRNGGHPERPEDLQ
jgi:hypothetical protein